MFLRFLSITTTPNPTTNNKQQYYARNFEKYKWPYKSRTVCKNKSKTNTV